MSPDHDHRPSDLDRTERPPHALVSGASIAGTATAFWLHRLGWRVTILERATGFRAGGQNIDVRGSGREVLDRMGLTEAVRARTTTEVGTRFVDEHDRPVGEFPTVPGEGDGLTAELEILRGDLATLVADTLPAEVRWLYGDRITAVRETADGVEVDLAGGGRESADLLVVAEGVRSSTRDLIMDDVVHDPLGLYLAYGTIPRTDDDDRWWRWYTAPGSRQATLRPDNRGTVRATLAYLSDSTGLETADHDAVVSSLQQTFADVGWQVPRILDGYADTDDLYVDFLEQIRLPHYARGRVVITGDAAWSVTPLAGGGATLALVGGYVLGAALSRWDGTSAGLDRALSGYEQWMRPFVDQVQKLPPGVPRLAYPHSRLGVSLLRGATTLAGTRPGRKVGRLLGSGPQADQPLPPFG
ncbi:2-polyprenyl-6-methoxyphenol hydroxylase-like FAD-dependent oxidoreductase [Friedmanniella endophytica]|uniref:2-polyprenyl-6-methoxyphenol hydroxylase-like FAD-dependent oxidoreductase n=1 Tax=Microlunatus kandeliicorticis TaxID=1759536 RepID=A0A7W3IUW6_9ACTN|nr:FAD-dependent monooxygenase [Microlunatus kandeliicorticis]MBA8795728.1 2-polyprenyl-6-methoxyphenol hydroxylase-like FAD-dependent oxidoreductase [Microlunatus kandeliicorticis]